MSHTAWSVKLSSTLVYGATSRWKSDDRTTREKAGRTERDILIADHRALEVDMMSGWMMIPSTKTGWLVGGMFAQVAERNRPRRSFWRLSSVSKNPVFMTLFTISISDTS